MKSIAVSIVTYNQEEVIGRALDSILKQKEWGLLKIVIGDDCSQDGTWDVLQGYRAKYPDFIVLLRNETNLGIYENVRRVEGHMPKSDLYCELAGDDELCDGYFECIQRFICEKEVDTNEAVGIYSDWMSIYPSGRRIIHSQSKVLSGNSLWSLKARGLICGRSLIISKRVKDGFEPILNGKGLNLTESHYDSQAPINIRFVYYIPKVTSIYYMGIGVSTRLNLAESNYLTTQAIEKWEYGIKHYVDNSQDLHYAYFSLIQASYYMKPSLLKLIKMVYHYLRGQLKGCHASLKSKALLFGGLAKYGLFFKDKISMLENEG